MQALIMYVPRGIRNESGLGVYVECESVKYSAEEEEGLASLPEHRPY